jgi:hypothetical protein
MAQSPEELERLRKSGAAGFQAQQQPAPAPKKKPKPSEEMAGVDAAPRWNLEGLSSLKASRQVIPNVDASKAVSPELQGTENLPRWSQTGDQGPRLSDQWFGYPSSNPVNPQPARQREDLDALNSQIDAISAAPGTMVERPPVAPQPTSTGMTPGTARQIENGNAMAGEGFNKPASDRIREGMSPGFKASIPGQLVGAVLGDNPIPGTGGLYRAVNERGPKIAQSLADGEIANAAGQIAGLPGDAFRYGLYGAMDTAGQVAGTAVGGFGNFMDGLAGRQLAPGEKKDPEVRPPLKPEQAAAEAPAAEKVEAETPATETTETETETPAADKTDTATTAAEAATAPRSNDITMTINEDGIKSFSGRNVGAGATLNGKPFSSSVNVVPSQGMRQLAAAVNPPMARQQPQQQAPALGFASRQAPQRTPKTEFEKQVEREIFRQATTAMRGAQNGQLTASQRGSLDKLAGNMSGERSGFDQQVLRNNGMLDQTAMTQAGQDRRDAGRLALDASRLAGDQYAQGFQIRQNERLERLREAYMAAETPEQRSAIAEQLKILNGSNADRKVSDNYVMVDQVYTNEYGQPEKVRVAIDPASGQVLGGVQQSQKWPQPTKANIAALKNDPKSAAQFDAMFGPGAAARYGVSL